MNPAERKSCRAEVNMHRDAIMEELRATRERLAAQHNYDVRALAEDAKKRERAGNRKVVKLARPAVAVVPRKRAATGRSR